uniref:Uncharacterized protein n=1 Tax=Meloidogyne floridensis TaxID=298350 RepID=A0A915PDE9_9BILA
MHSNTSCIISTIPLNEDENKNKILEQQQSLIDEQFKDCDSPQSGSDNFNSPPPNSVFGRQYLGALFISLPDGIILEFQQNNNIFSSSSNSSEEENQSEFCLKIGDSLFNYLNGKGAQTMLLNAFCGHSRRRMYARIKWGDALRACELLCEFFNDSKTSSRRLANIQLFCVQNIDIKQQQQHLFIKNKNLVFTTRHNSFLHSLGGTQIVKSSGLRLLTYSGNSLVIDSEWAAFVNPWTKHIEMPVNNNNKEQSELLTPPTLSSLIIQQDNQQQINTNLSYNQINCLENVHRLLKSQKSNSRVETEEDIKSIKSNQKTTEITYSSSNILTKELLQKHNQRWEEECRDNWNKKLSSTIYLKRKLIKEEEEEILPLKQLKCEENIINEANCERNFENSSNSPIPLKRKYSNNSQKYFGQEFGELFNCLQQKNKKEEINTTKIPPQPKQLNNNLKQNSELIEQLLQAANFARNTLAIKLLQKNNFSSSQQLNNLNYLKEFQFI